VATLFSPRAGLLGLTALLAAGVACGGGGDHKSVAEAKIVTTTTLAPTTTTTAPKLPASFDDLSRLIITAVPAGYTIQPNEVGDTGPSDLAKAVRDDGGNDARSVLTKDGFVRGYQRLWNKTDNDQVIAFLYQFNDHAGALDYAQRGIAEVAKGDKGVTVAPFDVPGIEGAVGLTGHDPTFSSSVVNFVKGPYAVQLVVNDPTPAGQVDLVRSLATDQSGRL
jgi:hypothetical protein